MKILKSSWEQLRAVKEPDVIFDDTSPISNGNNK